MIDNIIQENQEFLVNSEIMHNFAHQVIGEAILAVLSAPIKDLQVTTYDQQLVQATQLAIVDAIRNHFK